MRKNLSAILTVFVLLLVSSLIAGCAGGSGDISQAPTSESTGTRSGEVCGTPQTVTLFAGQHIDVGTVTVWNDTDNVYIKYETKDNWVITETHMATALSLAGIPQTKTGNPKVGNFPYNDQHSPPVTEYTYVVNYKDAGYAPGNILYIATHAVVKLLNENGEIIQEETAWGNGEGFPGKNWAMYFTYEIQACVPIVIKPGDFRTQTQGGWGTGANGNNPGAYRDANFAAAFPNGVTIGSADGYTVLLTTSSAVENFLPQGGPAAPLTKNYVDPKSKLGVLTGQVTALTLSVNFDLYDADFGASAINLKDLIVADENSPFFGMTVQQVLDEGNKVLGGVSSSFTAAQVNDGITSINENFVDGITVGEFLKLP